MEETELKLDEKQADALEAEPEQEPEAEAEVSDDDLLSAINDELEGVGDEPESEAEHSGNVEGKSDADVDDAPEPDAVEAAGDTDGEQPEAAKPDDKAEEPVEVAAEEAEPEKPAAETKPSDEFGELDKDVTEKTRERFDTLKERYDDLVAERDSVKQESDQWREAVVSTGTNPQQFGAMLTTLDLMNSNDPQKLEQAYNNLLADAEAIGKVLGKPVSGKYDPLSENPDLKSKVDEGMLDEESALEIAQARASQKLSAASQQQAEQQTQQQVSVQQGLDDVKALGAELMKSDPDFQAKMPILTPYIESLVESGVAPEKWAPSIRTYVAKIPVQAAPKPPPPKPTVPDPIRPTGASPANATMQSEPGSMMEAINQELERA